MKIKHFTRILLVVVGLSVVGIVLGFFIREQGKVWINKQGAGICLVRGGYRSWLVDYSYGQEINPDGSLGKSYYHKPIFRHIDLRWIKTLVLTNSASRWAMITNPPSMTMTNVVVKP